MNERKQTWLYVFESSRAKRRRTFCQSMNETQDGNIHSICLLKGIVLNRTVLSFPICSCFRIHKIPLILCLIALKIHVKFEGKQTRGLKNDMNNRYFSTNYINNWNLSRADTRVEFSNFVGLCFLKCKSLELKTVSEVSFCDNKGLWKVWAKTK